MAFEVELDDAEMVYSTSFAAGRGDRYAFQIELDGLGLVGMVSMSVPFDCNDNLMVTISFGVEKPQICARYGCC